jgi:hypothetical protein
MPPKQTRGIATPFGTWHAPKKSIAQGIEALEKHVSAVAKKRREMRVRDIAANRKVTTALGREFKKAGIDINKVGAVSLANSIRSQADMKKYRNRKPPSGLNDSGLSPSLMARNVHNFAPFNTSNFVRTPPYDVIANINPSPAPSPTSAWFNNASFNGGMNYYLDTPITSPAPSNFETGAAVGITFQPTFFGMPNPLFGFASVQMSAGGSLFMSAHAGSNFWGYGHSEGSVGWLVEEFDQSGNFLRFVQATYVEQYYLDSNWGQSASAFLTPPAFTSQTNFVTFPLRSYIILVWFWGDISASGAEGLWGSQASGYGEMAVQSISVNYSVSFFP